MAMEATLGLARPELIQVADTVAREKGIDREEVIVAMEQAIQKAGRSKYGHEHDIRADINRKSGEITLAKYTEVVETIENDLGSEQTMAELISQAPIPDLDEFFALGPVREHGEA